MPEGNWLTPRTYTSLEESPETQTFRERSSPDDGLTMSHVGSGWGDYVQVTTFRYAGKGEGNYSMVTLDDSELEQVHRPLSPCGPCLAMACLLVLLCTAAAAMSLSGVKRKDLFPFAETHAEEANSSGMSGIGIVMAISGADLASLQATHKLSSFDSAVREATAFYVGHGSGLDRISISLSPHDRGIYVDVIPSCDVDAKWLAQRLDFSSLRQAVLANLRTLPELSAIRDHIQVSVLRTGLFAAPCELHEVKQKLESRAKIHAKTGIDSLLERKPGRCDVVMIEGGTGWSKELVNGYFLSQANEFNGKALYRKEAASDIWLCFIKGQWFVTDAAFKDNNEGAGWLMSTAAADLPTDVPFWQVWDGQAWKNANISTSCHTFL